AAPDDIYHLDGLWDLVLCYDELLEALGLENAAFVGHSFGAMVACEVAAAYPRRARSLTLIAPIGFWRDAEPVVNWMMLDLDALRLWGQDDRVVPPAYADEFVRRLPGAGVQTMDGCGHAPQLEQPNRVAQMVRDFLRL